jgi:oxygen-independent coproporphyrinogen-3 oxidase
MDYSTLYITRNQALNDEDLQYLGRNHTAAEAFRAIDVSVGIFPNVTFDLIYGRHPKQTIDNWKKELKTALSCGSSHLSLYSLTFEPGTSFYRRLQANASQPSK